MSGYKAPVAIHPGETLREFLDGQSMAQSELASRTGLAKKTINEIVKGKNPITHDTAQKLSMVLGASASFWSNLQRGYDETLARLAMEKRIESELVMARKFTCFTQLVENNYIKRVRSIEAKAFELLKFLGISSFDYMEENYRIAYRKSETGNLSKENLIAWLRCGEIDAEKTAVNLKVFSKNKLKKAIPRLRTLTTKPPKEYSEKFVSVLAACGVALAYVPYLKNTFVNGATRWINAKNPLIQIAPRFKREDILFFTVFHELGHVMRHGSSIGYVNLDEAKRSLLSGDAIKAEKEADAYASNVLIRKSDWKSFRQRDTYTARSIREFASSVDISPSVVAGRLAYEFDDHASFHNLIRKVDISD